MQWPSSVCLVSLYVCYYWLKVINKNFPVFFAVQFSSSNHSMINVLYSSLYSKYMFCIPLCPSLRIRKYVCFCLYNVHGQVAPICPRSSTDPVNGLCCFAGGQLPEQESYQASAQGNIIEMAKLHNFSYSIWHNIFLLLPRSNMFSSTQNATVSVVWVWPLVWLLCCHIHDSRSREGPHNTGIIVRRNIKLVWAVLADTRM